MTKKSNNKTDKKGRKETWEWEETPETIEALKKLHETISKLESKSSDYGVGK
tara:strand:- start:58 stop:213 length:156 start_codon:yes stop_codon:yes gene_type:complete